jgi:hypothetical protein
MKKGTLISKSMGFITHIACIAIMLVLTQSLFAADILMGQYDFTTGTDQLKASSVTQGITMGDIVVGTGTAPITSTFNGGAIETSNWSSFMNIAVGKCVNLSITKQSNATEFNVSKIVVTLKRTIPTKFQINYGGAANTTTSRTYAAGTLHGTNSFTPITFTENINTGNTGVSVSAIPAVTDATPQFISIGTMYIAATSSAAEIVYIDKIEVWGTVTIPNQPTLTSSISSISGIKASKSHSVTTPITLTGANLTDIANLSIIGTDASLFSIDNTSYSAATLNGGPQTVNVTYLATATGAHTATLQIASTGAATASVSLSANCDVLYEDFANYDATALSNITLVTLPTMTNDVSLSRVTGWTGNYLYQYKAGSPNLGAACLGSTAIDSAYITTPALDLSQPFSLTFKARSLNVATDGRFNVYLDGTQLIYQGTNSTNALAQQTTQAFVGTATSKLTFTGRKIDGNEIVIDGIVLNNSANPALNISLNKIENFGSVLQGAEKTVDIPVQGYNLAGDLAVSLKYGTNFSLTSNATIPQATAASGSTMSVKFTSPFTTNEITDTLIIASTNLTSRKIAIKATPTISTEVTELKNSQKITVTSTGVELIGFEGEKLNVYNLVGVKMFEINKLTNMENFIIKNKGSYIINIQGAGKSISKKILL